MDQDRPRKEGYYPVIFVGGAGDAILYFDGQSFLTHGSTEPVDSTLLIYIASDPLDLHAIPNIVYDPA